MALIVDITSGAVSDTDNCYIIDEKSLTQEQWLALDSGTRPLKIAEMAKNLGTPIGDDAIEWIKYGWCTSVSYGPSSLKEEAEVLLDLLDIHDIQDATTRGFVQKFLEANEAEQAFIGESIMNSDDTWSGYRKNFVDALYEFYGKPPF